MYIKQRSFWTYLGLSIITCGIYHLYFLYTITDDVNAMCDDNEDITPVLAVVLTIVTCGLYTFWWLYKIGNRIQTQGQSNDLIIQENGSTYLLWALLGSVVCGIGTYVAYYLLIKNFNIIASQRQA